MNDTPGPVFQYVDRMDPVGAALSGVPTEPDGKWYFWSETWADAYGPYDSRAEAVAGCEKYAREVLG